MKDIRFCRQSEHIVQRIQPESLLGPANHHGVSEESPSFNDCLRSPIEIQVNTFFKQFVDWVRKDEIEICIQSTESIQNTVSGGVNPLDMPVEVLPSFVVLGEFILYKLIEVLIS